VPEYAAFAKQNVGFVMASTYVRLPAQATMA